MKSPLRESETHTSRIPVLMYHEVTNNPERQKKIRRIDPNYSLLTQKFEEQMEFLYENGYETVSPDEIIHHQANEKKICMLTFDDGFVGNHEFAFPVLKRCQFTATIFVFVGYISTDRYMNWDQLRELASNGFSIQSHTMTHSPLGELSEKEIFYELSESKKIIEKEIGKEVKYLSLPHGSWNKNVFRIADEVGYVGIFTSWPYEINLTINPIRIGRIPIKYGYNIDKFHQIVTKRSELYYKMKSENFIKNIVKKIIGLNNYRKIYRFIYRVEL